LGEFLVELINTSGGVDKLHLPGKERMRLARNLELDQRIFLAVFPFDGVPGLGARLGQEGEITGEILENHVPITGWMNIFFHDFFDNGRQKYDVIGYCANGIVKKMVRNAVITGSVGATYG
jgi:hypothetical protein